MAPLVGLYYHAQLTRHFRRIVGITPARYAGAASSGRESRILDARVAQFDICSHQRQHRSPTLVSPKTWSQRLTPGASAPVRAGLLPCPDVTWPPSAASA